MQVQESTTRKFRVKTLNDTVYDFEVAQTMKISELKSLIQEKANVPVDRQRLVYMAKLMDNDKTVGELIKENDVTIHLMAKTAEQVQQPTQVPSSQNQQPSPGTQQQPQQNQQPNFMAGLTGMLGFDPMSLIQQITGGGMMQGFSQPGQSGQQSQQGQQPMMINPLSGGFIIPNVPVNMQQPGSQSQPQQSQSQQPQPPQPHHHHHAHHVLHQHHPNQPQTSLPFNSLQSLGLTLNQMMGPGAMFPGPPLPQVQNRNSAQVMGGYLSQWHFQMSRLLPFIYRLGELLQREPLLTNPEDRAMTQQLVNRVPGLFSQVVTATNQVIPNYRGLVLGNSPGSFTLDNVSSGHGNQMSQPPQVVPANITMQVTSLIPGETYVPQGIVLPTFNVPSNILANQSGQQQNHQSQPQSQQSEQARRTDSQQPQPQTSTSGNNNQHQSNLASTITNSINRAIGPLSNLMGNLLPPGFRPSAPPSTTRISSVPQSSTQPTETTSNLNQAASNPLAAVQGIMSNPAISGLMTSENINMATSSNLRFMISEGVQVSPQNQSIYSLIFGDITGGDLIQLFMSSNYSFLDARRDDIRKGLRTALERYGNHKSALVEKMVNDILPILVSEEMSAAQEEGFDSSVVARQILEDHILAILNVILEQEASFSTRLVRQIREMIGELIYELTDGSTKDPQFIVNCIKASGSRVMDPYMMGMSGLMFMVLQRGMFSSYAEFCEVRHRQDNMTEQDHEKQKGLLKEIQRTGQEDKQALEKFVSSPKSEAFK